MFEKVDVNGPAAHPLFRYLKQALPGVLGGRIKWNFTKFLIGRDGTPHAFAPFTTPEKMEASIVAALTRRVFPSCHVHPAAAGCPQGRRRSHAASNRLLLANLPPARSSAYSGDTTSTSC